jgi:hypothetical protein
MGAKDLSLFVITPCHAGAVSDIYLQSMLSLQSTCSANDVLLAVMTVGQEAAGAGARNIALSTFLGYKEFSHVLLCDPYIGFSPESIVPWLESGRDMVVGAMPQGEIDWQKIGRLPEDVLARNIHGASLRYDIGFEDPQRIEQFGGLAKVVHAPLGLAMMRRQALERLLIRQAHRKFMVPAEGHIPQNEFMYALFERSIDPETQQILGEDRTFCQRWRESGNDIWLDTRARVVTASTYYFRGDVATQFLPALGSSDT